MTKDVDLYFELLKLSCTGSIQDVQSRLVQLIRTAWEERDGAQKESEEEPETGDASLSEIKSTEYVMQKYNMSLALAIRMGNKLHVRKLNGFAWTKKDRRNLEVLLSASKRYAKKDTEKDVFPDIETVTRKDIEKDSPEADVNAELRGTVPEETEAVPEAAVHLVGWDMHGTRHDFHSRREACEAMGIRTSQLDYMIEKGRTVNGWNCTEA